MLQVIEVWDYKNANVEGIQKTVSLINREKDFENLKINEKVDLLNNSLINIFGNYIPNKILKDRIAIGPFVNNKSN